MLIVISPAKTLDFETQPVTDKMSDARMQSNADYLIGKLRKLSKRQIRKLMDISENLAELNYDRYGDWNSPANLKSTKQAILAFKGDVYQGLEAETYSEEDFAFAQDHLRILSGLYGLLRPLDEIQPYRLEMGAKLKVTSKKENLYKYWGTDITDLLREDLDAQGDNVLVNLASKEYFSAVVPEHLNARIIDIDFKDWKTDQFKIISFFAKKARGLMSSYLIKNRITQPEEIKNFDWEGYSFNEDLSEENSWVFTRKE